MPVSNQQCRVGRQHLHLLPQPRRAPGPNLSNSHLVLLGGPGRCRSAVPAKLVPMI